MWPRIREACRKDDGDGRKEKEVWDKLRGGREGIVWNPELNRNAPREGRRKGWRKIKKTQKEKRVYKTC